MSKIKRAYLLNIEDRLKALGLTLADFKNVNFYNNDELEKFITGLEKAKYYAPKLQKAIKTRALEIELFVRNAILKFHKKRQERLKRFAQEIRSTQEPEGGGDSSSDIISSLSQVCNGYLNMMELAKNLQEDFKSNPDYSAEAPPEAPTEALPEDSPEDNDYEFQEIIRRINIIIAEISIMLASYFGSNHDMMMFGILQDFSRDAKILYDLYNSAHLYSADSVAAYFNKAGLVNRLRNLSDRIREFDDKLADHLAEHIAEDAAQNQPREYLNKASYAEFLVQDFQKPSAPEQHNVGQDIFRVMRVITNDITQSNPESNASLHHNLMSNIDKIEAGYISSGQGGQDYGGQDYGGQDYGGQYYNGDCADIKDLFVNKLHQISECEVLIDSLMVLVHGGQEQGEDSYKSENKDARAHLKSSRPTSSAGSNNMGFADNEKCNLVLAELKSYVHVKYVQKFQALLSELSGKHSRAIKARLSITDELLSDFTKLVNVTSRYI